MKTMGRDMAVRAAIRTCINRNILLHFLRENGSEVENMLLTEWNMKDALEVAREETLEEGIAIGEARGRQEDMNNSILYKCAILPSIISPAVWNGNQMEKKEAEA